MNQQESPQPDITVEELAEEIRIVGIRDDVASDEKDSEKPGEIRLDYESLQQELAQWRYLAILLGVILIVALQVWILF